MNSMAFIRSTVKSASDKLVTYMLEPVFVDQRTADWPLLSKRGAFWIIALYLIAIPITKQMMANRKPVNVTRFVFVHNMSMAALSLWMLIESVRTQYYCDHWKTNLRIWGSVAEEGKSFSPACHKLAIVLHVHFLSKALEFVDTFIMVLKRNDHQISFLHVYHHATTFLCWWMTMKIAPGGDTYFVCAINSFVHVIMYSYYLISSSKLIHIPVAIKKSITSLQLFQFGTVFLQVLHGFFIADYKPRMILYAAFAQTAFFMYLFGSFFRKSYASKKQR